MMMSDSDEELDALIKKAVHKTNKPSKTQWNCPSCTYANHKDLLECEMCEKPRSLTKSESGHMKSKLSIAISTIKSSETKVKLTSVADENAPSRAKRDAGAKSAESKQKNGPKIRPVSKFVPRPTPPRAASPPPPPAPSYHLDDVFTTSTDDPPRPSLLAAANVPSTSKTAAAAATKKKDNAAAVLAAAVAAKKKKKRPAAAAAIDDVPPANNPLDDLVPLGPAKKQKVGSSSSASASSKGEPAPFQKAAEKHRDSVAAKRAKILENKPNLMLKSPAEKNASSSRTDEEEEPRKKKIGGPPLIKVGAKSKASQLIPQQTSAFSSRSNSNSSTPPLPLPPSETRESSPSPVPDYFQSLVPSGASNASSSKPPVPSRGAAAGVVPRRRGGDPPDISGSERLNIWSIVYPMLKWNPSWLEEALKATEPPPVLDRVAPPERLKPTYEMFLEYHEIMHSPVLFEMWESVLRDFRERAQPKNAAKAFDRRLVISGVENIADDDRLWRLNCEYMCEDSPLVPVPQEGDFVQVEVPTLQHESATHPSFAWVDVVEKIRIRQDMYVHPMLNSMYGKAVWSGGKRTALNIKLQVIIHKYSDTTVDVYKPLPCRVLSSLIASIRQYQGLVVSPRSIILPHILKPHDPEVFQPALPPSPFKMSAAESTFNPSQTRAIQVSVNVMFQSTSSPKVLLLQGPPGTGKSHTVLGIISSFFDNCVIKAGGPKPRLLVCAPSNAGVDEIMRRLIALKKKSANSRISSLNLVRCGMTSSVHPDVEEITLDNLIRGGREGSGEPGDGSLGPSSTDKWVLEELKIRGDDLKGEIEELKRRRRGLKGVKGKEVELKEVETRLHKAMDEDQEIVHQQTELGRKARATEARTEKKAGGGVRNDFRNEAMMRIHILETAHIVGCTLNSSGSTLMDQAFGASAGAVGKRPQAFSCVIIDEACQAVELDCLIPLQHGVSKVIAVGDPEQLPATVLSKKSQELNFGCSLFERLYRVFQTESRTLFRDEALANFNPVLLLDTQYRMQPEICAFPSRHVYGGRIKTDTSVVERLSTRKCPFRPLLFFDLVDSKETSDSRGSAAGPSVSNLVEATFTVALCLEITKQYPPISIGVITPYQKQKALIQGRLRSATFRDEDGAERPLAGLVEVGTVDGFQGREKEFIILSCVRAQSDSGSIGFLSNKQRMNVALTRAKNGLFILGHARSLIKNRDWGALIADAHTRNSVTTIHANAPPATAVQLIGKDRILPPCQLPGEGGGGGGGVGQQQQQQQHQRANHRHMPPAMAAPSQSHHQGGRKPPKSKFGALRNPPSSHDSGRSSQGSAMANEKYDHRGRPIVHQRNNGGQTLSWYRDGNQEQQRPPPQQQHRHQQQQHQQPSQRPPQHQVQHQPLQPQQPQKNLPHKQHQQHKQHQLPHSQGRIHYHLPPMVVNNPTTGVEPRKTTKPRLADLVDNHGAIKTEKNSYNNNNNNNDDDEGFSHAASDPFISPSSLGRPSQSSIDQSSAKSSSASSSIANPPLSSAQSSSASSSIVNPPLSLQSSSSSSSFSLFPSSLLNPEPESPSAAAGKKTDGESTEEESPISRAKRINEELRNRFSNWDDDDDDNDDQNRTEQSVTKEKSSETKATTTTTIPDQKIVIGDQKVPSALEIRRLSEAEDGEIMSEDEDDDGEPRRPMVIPMEPEFTDDEDAMEMAEDCGDDASEKMDVDMRDGVVASSGCSGQAIQVSQESEEDTSSSTKTARVRRISPVRFP